MRQNVLLLSFLLCAGAQAQDGQPVKSGNPVKAVPALPTGRINGTVMCNDTHAPARGARVELIPMSKDLQGQNRTAHTDMTGHFTFAHLSSGEYFAIVSFPGYLNPLDTVEEPKDNSQEAFDALLRKLGTFTVDADAPLTANLTLVRGAAVSGKVLYSDGTPTVRAPIAIEDVKTSKAPMGSRIWNLNQRGQTTDDRGRFRLVGLKPGIYRIAVVAPRLESPANGEEGYESDYDEGNGGAGATLRIFAGNTYHRSQAKAFELRGGEETSDIDITIPLTGLHSVQGSVSAKDGQMLNMGELSLKDTSDNKLTFAVSLMRDGTYSFGNIPPGTYTLSIDAALGILNPNPKNDWEKNELVMQNKFVPAQREIIVLDNDLADINFALTGAADEKAPNAQMPAGQP